MTTTHVEDRLQKLERENRWMKRAALAALLVVSSALALGFDEKRGPKQLDPSQLMLRDEEGRERGRIIVSKDGIALVFTEEGQVRSSLLLTKNGAALKYLGTSRDPVSGVSAQSNGVGLGYRRSREQNDVGVNALMDVLGNALANDPLLTIPEKK